MKNEFTKHVVTLLSGSSIAQLFPLLLYPLITRVYTPEDLGLLALFMSISGLLSIVFTGRYEPAIMLPDKESDARHIFLLSLFISIFSFLVFQILFSLLATTIATSLNSPGIHHWLYWIPIFSFVFAIFQVLKYLLNRQKNYLGISVGNVLNSFTTGVLKVFFGLVYILPFAGLIMATIIGQFAGTGWFVYRVAKVKMFLPDSFSWMELKKLAKKYIVYPKFNLFHAIANSLSSNVPVFFFTTYFSGQVVGLYSLALGVAFRPLNLFSSSILQVTSQKIIEKYNAKLPIHHNYKQLIYFLIKWMTFPFILIFVFAPAIFSFIFGNEWTEAGIYLRYLLPWLYMLMFVAPLSFTPEIFYKQKKAMIIDLIYLALRFLSLYTGVLLNNVYLGLGLFSFSGVVVMGFNLTWYLKMTREADKKILENHKE